MMDIGAALPAGSSYRMPSQVASGDAQALHVGVTSAWTYAAMNSTAWTGPRSIHRLRPIAQDTNEPE